MVCDYPYVPEDIRLERRTTRHPWSQSSCAIRVVAHILDTILLIGFFRCLWNAHGRSFADTAVNTVVIWDERSSR